MFKKAICGSHITPACAYCTHGMPSGDKKMILCRQRGVVSPYYFCRKYQYDPFLRIPHRQKLPHFDPDDFSLE